MGRGEMGAIGESDEDCMTHISIRIRLWFSALFSHFQSKVMPARIVRLEYVLEDISGPSEATSFWIGLACGCIIRSRSSGSWSSDMADGKSSIAIGIYRV